MSQVSSITKCRACGGERFSDVVNLGSQYVVDFPKVKDELLLKAPLHVVKCTSCSSVQLLHSVQQERLFNTFWYRSGINEMMKNMLLAVTQRAQEAVDAKEGDRVLDIGCNDGTLLGWYPPKYRTVGIDPCKELVLAGQANHQIDVPVHGFFSKQAVSSWAPYKIITAISMFYDLEDPVQFLKDCKDVLDKTGVLIIQNNYLLSMLRNCAFDNISHEHLMYYSYSTMKPLVEKAGLEIMGVQLTQMNGGSFRLFISHPGVDLWPYDYKKRLDMTMACHIREREEQHFGLDSDEAYSKFALAMFTVIKLVKAAVLEVQKQGGRLYIYGASTRGTTLMQTLGLPDGTFVGAAERDKNKWGRMMVGSWTPIVPEEEARANATHMLVLPWHFFPAIKEREKAWLLKGGKFIVPLPTPRLVGFHQTVDLATGQISNELIGEEVTQ